MHHKRLRKAQKWAAGRKAWAIIKDDTLVAYDNPNAPVHPLLIFDRKYQAHGALWKPDEKVVAVRIVPA